MEGLRTCLYFENMDIEDFRLYCMSKSGVKESFPFDNETLVFKVAGKIFALANVTDFNSVNLKCIPEKALELRETYEAVTPGYHMNKHHWNTVSMLHGLPDQLIKEWVDLSYDLVFAALPKKLKEQMILRKEVG